MTQKMQNDYQGKEQKEFSSMILTMLQSIPVFGGIPESVIEFVLGRASSITIREGEYLFEENDTTNSMYVLIDGSVSVLKSIEGHEYELCQLGPGDCVGELELIDLCPRAASVKALKNSHFITLDSKILHEIHSINEEAFTMIYMNLGREVSRRLRWLDANMLNVREISEAEN